MYKIGDKINKFTLKNIYNCDEIGGTLYDFEHDVNGCRLFWMKTDDDNKLFSVAFRTIPTDDTGVFHILEHSVLNGSEKYPVKEPFVDLLKSSMNTFLNAMTYGDKTVYPVSSRNQKDLFNLMDVYLDAVFKPKIYENPNIFYQEGWHVELTEKGAEPVYKGVVFNEMKGALSGVDAQLELGLYRSLFKGSCYGFESGGDPVSIPTLTYEKFIETHKKFYHPSNAVFYLDGDMDFEGAGEKISAYVDKYERGNSYFVEEVEPLPPEKKTVFYDYTGDDPENSAYMVMGRILPSKYSKYDIELASALMSYLAGNNVSPLKKAVLDAGLATDFYACVETTIKQTTLSIRADNIKKENAEKIKEIVKDVISDIVKNGIDRADMNAIINHVEFTSREVPAFRGMAAMNPLLNAVNFKRDIAQAFEIKAVIDFVRGAVESGQGEKMLSELFDLDLMTEVIALPSATLGAEQMEEEKKRLNDTLATWSESDFDAAVALNKRLAEWQASEDTPEASATIPKLLLSDVPREGKEYKLTVTETNGITELFLPISRKGTYYINFFFGIEAENGENLAKLNMLSDLLLNLPTENYTVKELKREIRNYCGKFSVSLDNEAGYGEALKTRLLLRVSVSVLEKYLPKALELVREVLLRTKFDDKNEMHKLIKQTVESGKIYIAERGHTTAMRTAGQFHSARQYADECMNGFTALDTLRKLTDDFDSAFEGFAELLRSRLSASIAQKRLVIGITGSEIPDLSDFVASLPEGSEAAPFVPELPAPKSVGIVIPAGIAFTSKATNMFEFGRKYTGSMSVMDTILDYTYLWNEIRVKGGAYGTGFSAGNRGGVVFYSYRDPSPEKSLTVFDASPEFIRGLASENEPLDSYIISTISNTEPLKSIQSIGAELQLEWMNGLSPDYRQNVRNRILDTTNEELLELADFLDEALKNSTLAVVGSKALVEKVNPDVTYTV